MGSFFERDFRLDFQFENYLETPIRATEEKVMGQRQENPLPDPSLGWNPWNQNLPIGQAFSVATPMPSTPWNNVVANGVLARPRPVIRPSTSAPSAGVSRYVQPLEPPGKRIVNHLPTNDDYRLYGEDNGWNCVGEVSKFYVEPRKGVTRGQPREFRLRLLKKDGTYVPLALNTDTTYRGRYVCFITPPEAGDYILAATYTVRGQQLDIRGSPQSFRVVERESLFGNNGTRILPIGSRPALSATENGKILGKPWGLAVHRRENYIYVTDRLQHCVLVYNVDGEIIRKFGNFGTKDGQLYRPTGIAIDETRNRVLVTDKDNHRVAVFSTDGKFLKNFGNKGFAAGDMNYPWGISVSPDGMKIVVADSRNHRIQLFHGETYSFMNKFSVFESNPYEYRSTFDYPRDVLFDSTGKFIYVTDFNIHAVFKIDAECKRKATVSPAKMLCRPQGMAWDDDGNLLVADSSHKLIRVFSPAGKYLRDVFTGRVRLIGPTNVSVLRGGKIAIIDGRNNALHII